MSSTFDLNERPGYDTILQTIADYVLNYQIDSAEAWETARHCLMDTLGCGLLALRFPECTKHLGPLVEGTVLPKGGRVPAHHSAWTRSKQRGTLAVLFAGWITTIPGLQRSGGILRITWAAYWQSRTTCRKSA